MQKSVPRSSGGLGFTRTAVFALQNKRMQIALCLVRMRSCPQGPNAAKTSSAGTAVRRIHVYDNPVCKPNRYHTQTDIIEMIKRVYTTKTELNEAISATFIHNK